MDEDKVRAALEKMDTALANLHCVTANMAGSTPSAVHKVTAAWGKMKDVLQPPPTVDEGLLKSIITTCKNIGREYGKEFDAHLVTAAGGRFMITAVWERVSVDFLLPEDGSSEKEARLYIDRLAEAGICKDGT